METYLVTGCSGFIGSHLAVRLLDLGHRVVGFDNFSGSQIENLADLKHHPQFNNFTFIEGDIRDVDQCVAATRGCDYVLHQAALGSVPRSLREPMLYHHNNITGTVNMMLAARDEGVKRFVFASSSSVYGNTPTLPKVETMVPAPLSPYAVSKLTTESYAHGFFHSYGFPAIGLRYFNVFGPRQNPYSQYAAVIPKFVTACRTNTPIIIYGDGEQSRDFTYVDNVVEANLRACDCPASLLGQAVNVGCGDRITILMLAEKIKVLMNSSVPIIHEPTRAGDVRDSLAGMDRLLLLGLTHPISLDDGLATTIRWYLDTN